METSIYHYHRILDIYDLKYEYYDYLFSHKDEANKLYYVKNEYMSIIDENKHLLPKEINGKEVDYTAANESYVKYKTSIYLFDKNIDKWIPITYILQLEGKNTCDIINNKYIKIKTGLFEPDLLFDIYHKDIQKAIMDMSL